jgi:hypothetical protein
LGGERGGDGEEFLDAMIASVAAPDRCKPVRGQRVRQIGVMEDGADVALHGSAVLSHQEAVRREERLRVDPRRAHQRNGAGERLEDPDRRNPGQRSSVRPPRHMHGEPVSAKVSGTR